MFQKNYGNIIWTNHALERLGQRGLSQDMALNTFQNPDKTIPGKNTGTTEYTKKFGISTVTVIAKPNEKREWIVLSCWIDPPLYGTDDYKKREEYKKYRKAGFWGKLWHILKQQVLGK